MGKCDKGSDSKCSTGECCSYYEVLDWGKTTDQMKTFLNTFYGETLEKEKAVYVCNKYDDIKVYEKLNPPYVYKSTATGMEDL